jgi:hypothetical protein
LYSVPPHAVPGEGVKPSVRPVPTDSTPVPVSFQQRLHSQSLAAVVVRLPLVMLFAALVALAWRFPTATSKRPTPLYSSSVMSRLVTAAAVWLAIVIVIVVTPLFRLWQ